MPKRKVSANELGNDIRSGMDDSTLMQKHHSPFKNCKGAFKSFSKLDC